MLRDFSLRDFGASLNTVESYTNESSQGKIGLCETVNKQKCTHLGMFLASEYLLSKECRNTVNSELTCNIIPHLDVNKIISITNNQTNYNDERFIVNSITLPVGTSNMSISATNIQSLPDFTCNVNM